MDVRQKLTICTSDVLLMARKFDPTVTRCFCLDGPGLKEYEAKTINESFH
jgi:hypothetical protein